VSSTIRVPSLDPETGAAITIEQALEPVGGVRLLFSAPKSVSLASALASAEVRREVVDAHHAAVEATRPVHPERTLKLRGLVLITAISPGRRRSRCDGCS
jgi:hypothetical protein